MCQMFPKDLGLGKKRQEGSLAAYVRVSESKECICYEDIMTN